MNNETPRPSRRKRDSGKSPQKSADKEIKPALHPEAVAKVDASAKASGGSPVPSLMDECLDALALTPGMTGVDATLGHGDYASRILEEISPEGNLIGLDVDPVEMPKTEARMRAAGFGEDRFKTIRTNYAGISRALAGKGIYGVDFIFADLGCSSMQFDDPSRGFDFKVAGPLDMRMNPSRGLTAADWLAKVSPAKLTLVLNDNGDEPHADVIAKALAGKRYDDTLSLATAIREAARVSDKAERELTVGRVFRAVRMAVNEEFKALDAFLRALPGCLNPGGRAAILTFEAGEDRRVKQAMKDGLIDGVFSDMSENVTAAGLSTKGPIHRSNSPKLRWVTRK